MGASQSVSHFAHPEPGHRFKRVDSKDLNTKVTCRMCWEEIKTTGVAYHCQRCVSTGGFFIHDVCFHRQQTIESHWAHAAHPSHPLTLSTTGNLQIQQGLSSDDPVVCTLCAEALDPRAFAYVCSRRTGDGHDCHGFSAHPSCCIDFSRKLMVSELHKHELTLLSPPHHHDGRRRRSTCLNPQCRSRGKQRLMTTAPWSYQCPPCNVHLCLPCRVQGEGEGNCANKNQPGSRCGKDLVIDIFGCMGEAMGTFGRRFTCACMGNPGA
jgi:hypothetical protein